MVSKASDDLPDPESPVKTTSLSRGMDSVTFFRLCSRAPRIVMWSVGIFMGFSRTFGYSVSLVIANVPLAVATRRPPKPSTRHSVTAVRRPAWTTRPVARSVSPTFATVMKLSFRSKLIARTTPGLIVCSARPIAESASALIMPPWTKPALFAMSSVAVISTVALPSPSISSRSPSQVQAGDANLPIRPRGPSSPASGEGSLLLTALALRNRHACRGCPRDKTSLLVENVGFAEKEGLAHVDHPAHRAKAAFDGWPEEVDLELDRGVPHPVFLKCRQRHAHGGIGDLGDHPALNHAPAVAVPRAGGELEDDAARPRLGHPGAQGLHPAGRLGGQQLARPLEVLDLAHALILSPVTPVYAPLPGPLPVGES